MNHATELALRGHPAPSVLAILRKWKVKSFWNLITALLQEDVEDLKILRILAVGKSKHISSTRLLLIESKRKDSMV